ncbi:MAG: hypothetical protein ACK5KL_04160 [Dysgonomonas sp.]|jgi:hypothetical protein|nr:hypothetical protein [Prevotella sp.]
MKKNRFLYVLGIIVIIVSANFIQGCDGKKEKREVPQEVYDEMKLLSQTPDSLLTPEQLQKRENIIKVIASHVTVKDNHYISTATARDFEDNGLSGYYYDLLEKNVEDINRFIDSTGMKNVEEMYKESLKETMAGIGGAKP